MGSLLGFFLTVGFKFALIVWYLYLVVDYLVISRHPHHPSENTPTHSRHPLFPEILHQDSVTTPSYPPQATSS